MSHYHNLCIVRLLTQKCNKDPYTAYTHTAAMSAIFGVMNVGISVGGAVVINKYTYQDERDICFDSFLFNFLMTFYIAIYGISLIYNASMILRAINVRWCYIINLVCSIALIVLGSIDYDSIKNNCSVDSMTIYFEITFWYNVFGTLIGICVLIYGYNLSKHEDVPIMNDGTMNIYEYENQEAYHRYIQSTNI